MIQKAIARLEYLINIIPGKLEKINEHEFSYKPSPKNGARKKFSGI